jgi:hypothetical protein
MNSEHDPCPAYSLAHLVATVDRNVADLRSGEISGRDVRAIARQRRRNERDAWAPIRDAALARGSR